MQSDEKPGETEAKVGAEFSISGKETHGCVCRIGKNDTPGCVDIIPGGQSESGRPKKADRHLVFELV